MPDIIVVGAGAAGIIAAWRAASLGASVVLIEKTNRLGTKILISGGGKCNITHDGPIESVLKAFRPEEARFIRPACHRFRNDQIVEMLTAKGLEVMTRPDGRIFPVDATAKDVVAILASYLEESGVDVWLETPASGLIIEQDQIRGIRYRRAGPTADIRKSQPNGYMARTAKNLLSELDPVAHAVGDECELRASRIILCTGGSSYPNSGTTGDGWPWVRSVNHMVERLRAALAPIYLKDPCADLAGVSLRSCLLKARQGREAARWTGDLLFTHQGVSGPAALGISRSVAEAMERGGVTLEIDLQPDLSPEEASRRLMTFLERNPTRRVAAYVGDVVPDRITSHVMSSAGIREDLNAAQLDRKSRNRLLEVLKAWPLGEVRHVPLEKGEVVAGGVSLNDVDPKTMESRIVPGLYLCGEILDIAGPVGGYNLQAAFATGFVAGESAARAVLENSPNG